MANVTIVRSQVDDSDTDFIYALVATQDDSLDWYSKTIHVETADIEAYVAANEASIAADILATGTADGSLNSIYRLDNNHLRWLDGSTVVSELYGTNAGIITLDADDDITLDSLTNILIQADDTSDLSKLEISPTTADIVADAIQLIAGSGSIQMAADGGIGVDEAISMIAGRIVIGESGGSSYLFGNLAIGIAAGVALAAALTAKPASGSNDDGVLVNMPSGSTGDAVKVQNNGATVLVIEPDGDVGIGTDTPAYPLDVAGGINATNNIVTPWVDRPLASPTLGSHFNDNDSSYPQGWTEVNAASVTNTNTEYGFWYIEGAVSGDWKYRKQLDYNFESETASPGWASINFGPIMMRDANFISNVRWTFGMYADNVGSINEDIFTRLSLEWNVAAGVWQCRHEEKNGTTQTDGAWFPVSKNPVLMPLYFRAMAQYNSGTPNRRLRAALGSTPIPFTHTLAGDVVEAVTWGDIWVQIDKVGNTSGGRTDVIYIGGIDLSPDA